jgi:hypothetical protein
MGEVPMSSVVKDRIRTAARQLGAADPVAYVGSVLDRAFPLPLGDGRYAENWLTPGTAPFEPSYSESEPGALRFTLEPLGPGASPVSRRDEATRENRRLAGHAFGKDALRWFDECSEEWRGLHGVGSMAYGAWFGSAYDRDGLAATKVYYELGPGRLDGLPRRLAAMARVASQEMPSLIPVFTSISCRRDGGSQRVTFLHAGPLRVKDLEPLMARLRLAEHMPALLRIVGVTMGGRFELPGESVLLGLGEANEGPEIKLEILLGRVPDLPPQFLDLLALSLSERPQHLTGLVRWLRAFTPQNYSLPGDFSVMSIRVTPQRPPRVSLYLRPIEFEVGAPAAALSA